MKFTIQLIEREIHRLEILSAAQTWYIQLHSERYARWSNKEALAKMQGHATLKAQFDEEIEQLKKELATIKNILG